MSCATLSRSIIPLLVLFFLLAPAVSAHGEHAQHEHGMSMSMSHDDAPKKDPSDYPPTYFAHGEYVGWIYAHIALTIISCVFVLPLGKLCLSDSPLDVLYSSLSIEFSDANHLFFFAFGQPSCFQLPSRVSL